MSDVSERLPRAEATLKKLLQLVEEHKLDTLTAEDVINIREMAAFWRGYKALKGVARAAQRMLIWLAWAAGFWLTFKTGFVDWLKGSAP